MARVYSSSQGKFIDTPDAAATPSQNGASAYAGTQPDTQPDSTTTTSLGLPDAAVRNLFFKMGMSNPKSVNTLKDLYGFIAPKPLTTAEQKQVAAKDSLDKAKSLSQNAIGNILTQYSTLSPIEKQAGVGKLMALNPFSQAYTYNQQRKGLYASLKDVAGAGAGSGVRINNYDIQLWANLLPEPGDTQEQVKRKITSLNTQLKGKFGEGLDPEYLQEFGVNTGDSSNSKFKVLNVSQ
jgi:hypothetical protein